jgi:hypothetical protein
MLRRIARAGLEGVTTRIRRRPAFFAVLGAIVIFSTVLIKDNIAEAIRSNIQAVEFGKQFYELHIEDIDLNARLNEVGDFLEELKIIVSNKDVSNALQETIDTGIQNHNEAVKNIKLIQAANVDTEELLRHISDSIFFFTYSDGGERILRNDLKQLKRSLEALRTDIGTLKREWNVANRLVAGPNHQFTSGEMAKIVDAYKQFSHDAEAAAIQSAHLEAESRGDRGRAIEIAESYRRFLEEEDDVCKWALIFLVVIGSVLSLVSQLAGVEDGAIKNL